VKNIVILSATNIPRKQTGLVWRRTVDVCLASDSEWNLGLFSQFAILIPFLLDGPSLSVYSSLHLITNTHFVQYSY